MSTTAPPRPARPQLTLAEVADRIGIACNTLRKWLDQGIGPRHYLFGERVIRFDQADVDQWIADHEGGQ